MVPAVLQHRRGRAVPVTASTSGATRTVLCVVEEPRDIVAVERTHEFRGRYHVLQGAISPIEGIGPEQLRIKELLARVGDEGVDEVILATNPNIEGEATAMYLAELLKPLGRAGHPASRAASPSAATSSTPTRSRSAAPSKAAATSTPDRRLARRVGHARALRVMTLPTASVSVRKPSWPAIDSITSTPVAPRDQLGELVLEPQRVEAVRRDAGDASPAPVMRASAAAMPPRPRPTSWWFIASRQHDVGVRVEARGELLAVVLEVRLDRVAAAVERVARRPGGRARTARRTRARTGSSPGRCRARSTSRAAGPRRARRRSSRRRGSSGRPGSRGSAASTARSPRRSPWRRTAIDDRVRHAVGERDRPLEHAHAAHRPADDRGPPVDAEPVGERGLDHDLVADRDDREARAVRRARRPGRSTPGPVVPWQPPSTLGHTTKKRSVSIGAPGPTMPSHQPGRRWPGPAGPAAWLSPVSAWSTSTAFDASASSVPHVSYATVTCSSRPPASRTCGRASKSVANWRRPGGRPGATHR